MEVSSDGGGIYGGFVVSQTGMQTVSLLDVPCSCAFQIEQNVFVCISVCTNDYVFVNIRYRVSKLIFKLFNVILLKFVRF